MNRIPHYLLLSAILLCSCAKRVSTADHQAIKALLKEALAQRADASKLKLLLVSQNQNEIYVGTLQRFIDEDFLVLSNGEIGIEQITPKDSDIFHIYLSRKPGRLGVILQISKTSSGFRFGPMNFGGIWSGWGEL